MPYSEKDIMHETKNHFVIKVTNGFEVYKNVITHATRCAQIGCAGQKGLDKAIEECKRREALIK